MVQYGTAVEYLQLGRLSDMEPIGIRNGILVLGYHFWLWKGYFFLSFFLSFLEHKIIFL